MSQLSSNFSKTPKYSKEVSLQNGEELKVSDPQAIRSLIALMNMEAVLGGAAAHWGGPTAFVEITSVLTALMFKKSSDWYNHFHFINDAGHCENGLYAIKANYNYAKLNLKDLRKFRSISSFLTGHGEQHLFPQGVYLSNGPLGSTLSQAQGLCMADRFKQKDRITIALASDGALMEGEAKEALSAIPGLAQKNKMNPFLLIVSDNNTKLTGRIDEDSFSMKPTFDSLESLGWHKIDLRKAHDLQSVSNCLEQALEKVKTSTPVVIVAQTIKGYGNQKTAESSSGGHGFPLKDPKDLKPFLEEIYQEKSVPEEFIKWMEDLIEKNSKKQTSKTSDVVKEKSQVGISKAMIEKAEKGLPIVSITSDLPGSTGVMNFRKKFPEKSFDVGVAESNMFSVAAGFSKEGLIPVVDTFAQFGVTKGALPLFMATLSSAPVIAILSHVGFQDAADGASHQSLTYIAQTGSIPNTLVYTISSSEEAYHLLSEALENFKKNKKNYIFFLGRENFLQTYKKGLSYSLDKSPVVFSQTQKSKKGCTLVATGTVLSQALEAGKHLAEKGWSIHVVHSSIINEPDTKTIESCLKSTQGNLLTVEDHQLKGGMGSFLNQALSLKGVDYQIQSLGVGGKFGRSAYKAIELYKLHGLDKDSIIKAAQSRF